MIAIAELKTGVIFGDNSTCEYVYMPASEIGMENPLCVYENNGQRSDVDGSPAAYPRAGFATGKTSRFGQ